MLLLYHSQPTGNSYKVRLLLSILQIAYESVDVDIFNGGNKTDAYRRINPLGKVPALQLEDGSILTESNAILAYLATGTEFLPEEKHERAKVLQWMFFEQYSHLPYIGVARYYLHLLKKRPIKSKFQELYRRGNLALEIMDRHLAGHQWFVGVKFSIADIALYAYTHVAPEGGFSLARYPAVLHWIQRVQHMPRYVPLMERPARIREPAPSYKSGKPGLAQLT
jgi:glutathione S-transferase